MKNILIAITALITTACNPTNSSNESNLTIDTLNNSHIDTTHTSENSLDWEGTYIDTTKNVETTIVLSQAGSFQYLSKDITSQKIAEQDSGKILWINNSSSIQLKGSSIHKEYKVGENTLITEFGRINKIK